MAVNATRNETHEAGAEVVELRANRVSVRTAQLSDLWGIYNTLLDALDATETPFPDPDMPYCLQAMLDRIHTGCVCVAVTPEHEVVGCIVLNVRHWPWCDPKKSNGAHFFNEHLWVSRRYRRGGTATKFIEWAKNFSTQNGLPLMLEISSIDDDGELKDRFLKTRGFKYLGGAFYWSKGGHS